MNDIIDVFVRLAFELGGLYQHIYKKAELDNIINFNDITYANSRGAQWNLKGDMSDLPELFKLKDKNKIEELNKVVQNLEYIKMILKEQINEGVINNVK